MSEKTNYSLNEFKPKISSKETDDSSRLIKSQRKPLGLLSTNTNVDRNSEKNIIEVDDDIQILENKVLPKKRKHDPSFNEPTEVSIVLEDSDYDNTQENKSKKLCVNPLKSNNENTLTLKSSNILDFIKSKRTIQILEQEDGDDVEFLSKTTNSKKKLKHLDDDEDSLPPILDDDEHTRKNSNKTTLSYKAHFSKYNQEDDDEYFPDTKNQQNNNKNEKYEPNDSLTDDNTDVNLAVSRKHSGIKKCQESSSTDNEETSSEIFFTQHKTILDRQKKHQGYNTDNIGEDLAFKDELKRKEQTTGYADLIKKPDVTVTTNQNNPTAPTLESNEDEGDEINPVETFIVYKPKKLKKGLSHPDIVVETTSLASVDQPELTYQMKLPKDIYRNGKLSNLQLEALLYCCQAHENMLGNGERRGFLLGDGAGVGKGRTIAGIIFENILNNRTKAIWLSVSSDLIVDTRRDINDIGITSNHKLFNITDMDYKQIKEQRAILFGTYRSLISKKVKPSYDEFPTRLEQIIAWCGSNFDGVLVFDESHKAKNLVPEKGTKPTKIGEAVRDIQKRLPKARVVYASATGASDCKNMAYMSRLGLWGSDDSPFKTLPEFTGFIGESGVTAMEMVYAVGSCVKHSTEPSFSTLFYHIFLHKVVALDLKWQGIFTARQLSFDGATFEIRNVELDQNHVDVYNRSVELWAQMLRYMHRIKPLNDDGSSNLMRIFWSNHQRFFRYLCVAAKIDETVRITREAVKAGNCVVIGLQMTGESQSIKQTTKDLSSDEISSTAYGSLFDTVHSLPDIFKIEVNLDNVENICFPGYNPRDGTVSIKNVMERIDLTEYILSIKTLFQSIHHELKNLKDFLPANSLDKLINDLGGPSKVAEMTGRKMTTICNQYDNSDDDSDSDDDKENKATKKKYTFQKRQADNPKKINIEERNKFMKGQKLIAIISDASSAGISLQALKGCENQRRRLHITLELPWSADKAVQQFGRTHRSNQVQAPDYLLLISKLAGENRFASSVAKRIESMNAITNADRNATKTRDLNCFNIEHSIGNRVVKHVISSIKNASFLENVRLPSDYTHEKFLTEAKKALQDVDLFESKTVDKNFQVKTFLNRLLGCSVEIQNAIFEYFGSAMENEKILAKREGRYDSGMENVDLSLKDVIKRKDEEFSLKDNRKIYFNTFTIKDGMSFREVFGIFEKNNVPGNANGFYYRRYGWNIDIPHLAIKSTTGLHKYIIFSPTNGKEAFRLTETELKNDYRKVVILEDFTECKNLSGIKTAWKYFYGKTGTSDYYILSGSILTVFLKVRMLFPGLNEKKTDDQLRFQMVRVNLGNNNRVIGIKLPTRFWIDKVKKAISEKVDSVEKNNNH